MNCIRFEFDCSCFRRVLNDILMNCVVNRKFHKTGEYLYKLSNHWHLRKYCILDVFSVTMISSALFVSDVIPPPASHNI
jgi:hypothetical protein